VAKEKTVTVVGAGIVGLAIARSFSKRGLAVTVLEKETRVGLHQTGRNSGVIHAGPYYKPGSLKSQLCVSGSNALKLYARDRGIKFSVPGKLIVATDSAHYPRVEEIHKRALENGVKTEVVRAGRIQELEPSCVAEYGLHVKDTGAISYLDVAQNFADEILELGGSIKLNSEVSSIRNVGSKVAISHGSGEELSNLLVNAAGLESDRIANLAGIMPKIKIVPFKGQYFNITPGKSNLVRGMVYPAPNPAMPFLGVHLTKSLDGSLHAGPNAILAMGREAYTRGDVNARDLSEVLLFPGFWRFISSHKEYALKEGFRVASKRVFLAELSKLIEGIELEDLTLAESGIRAQAMTRQGQLVDDFVIERLKNQIHILNAPSPAATACLAIADWIVNSSHSSD